MVSFLSVFIQKPCNIFQPPNGVILSFFYSKILQDIPTPYGVLFVCFHSKNLATYTNPYMVSFLSLLSVIAKLLCYCLSTSSSDVVTFLKVRGPTYLDGRGRIRITNPQVPMHRISQDFTGANFTIMY